MDITLASWTPDFVSILALPVSIRIVLSSIHYEDPLRNALPKAIECLDILQILLSSPSSPPCSSSPSSTPIFSSVPLPLPSPRLLILLEPLRQVSEYSIDLVHPVANLLELCAERGIDVAWDPSGDRFESLVSPAFWRWVDGRREKEGKAAGGTPGVRGGVTET